MNILLTNKEVADLKIWFDNYVKTFKYDDSEIQQNIDLKEQHTKRVCNEILKIGIQLGLNENELHLAETVALLHDIGRFEQYDKYRTFSDINSEDHAKLGIRILNQKRVIDKLITGHKQLIFCIIDSHNKPEIPSGISEQCKYFSKLLRDADKLDIFRIVTGYYNRNGKRNGTLTLDLHDTPGFSEDVYNDLLNRHIVNIKHVQNLNDFKLLQLGWIFDINFKATVECVKENKYLEKIRDVLPESREISDIFEKIIFYRDEKLDKVSPGDFRY